MHWNRQIVSEMLQAFLYFWISKFFENTVKTTRILPFWTFEKLAPGDLEAQSSAEVIHLFLLSLKSQSAIAEKKVRTNSVSGLFP